MKAVIRCSVLVAVVLGLAGPAHAGPEKGSYFIGVSGAITTQSLDDLNDVISSTRGALDILHQQGVVRSFDWDDLGTAVAYGFEAGYHIGPAVALGVSVDLSTGSRDHGARFDYDDGAGSFIIGSLGEEPKVSLWEVTSIVVLRPAAAPSFSLGAQAGVVHATLRQRETVSIVTEAGTTSLNASGEWSGNGLVLGAFAGYEHALSGNFAVTGRIGYRLRNVAKPDGTYRVIGSDQGTPVDMTFSGPPSGVDGQPMDLQLSGLAFRLGLRLSVP